MGFIQGLSTRELWDLNSAHLAQGMRTGETGAELMRRTDCSEHRRRQANKEQAERRKAMPKKEREALGAMS